MVQILPPPLERRDRLKELEAVITAGWEGVVEIGRALREIRDDGLYLEIGEGLTFEGYVRTRWAMQAAHAYRQIDAAEVAEAVSPLGEIMPINTEFVGRELAPLLRQGGKPLVAEAWAKVAERFEGQRPPTAREVHQVLVEEGYREKAFGVSSGKLNRRIKLGQFGDKLIAAEKRLNWFSIKEIGDKPLAKRDRELAAAYAEKCEAMAQLLRSFAAGKTPE